MSSLRDSGVLFAPWLALWALAGCGGSDPVSGGACVTNQQCPAGEQCVAGTCVSTSPLGCKNDDACALGEFCDPSDGVCKEKAVVGCATDIECPRDQRCNTLTGVCIDGRRSCRDDSNCQQLGMVCEPTLQQCVDCYEPGQCASPAVCIDYACVDQSTPCGDDGDCNAPSTVCENASCVAGCGVPGSSVTCGFGTFCNTNTGRCEAGQVTCGGDSECSPPATICESGQCIPGCTQVGGLQCTGGTSCNASTGRCETNNACTVDANCAPPATVCESGTCVAGCGQPAGLACGAGTVCDTGTGRCVNVSGPCTSDAQCGAPQMVCEGGQCVGGCAQIGGIQCSGNTVCNSATGRCDPGGAVCTSDAQCAPPATICNLGTGACDQGCGATGCPTGQTCNTTTGHCYTGQPTGNLPLNATCVADNDCQSGDCFDFGSGIGAVCVSSCGSHTDCPAGFTCYDHFGGKMCVSSQLFSGASFSTPNGGSCTQGGQCQSNFCPGNVCTGLCSDDADCAGGVCRWSEFTADRYIAACNGPAGAGANGASCGADSDCRSGVCYGSGTCGDLCGSTADCPNGNICAPVNYSVCTVDLIFTCLGWEVNLVKACIQSPHGAAVNGTQCSDAQGSNCRDGFCYNTSNQCTGVCSRDADCPASMKCGVEVFGDLDGQEVYVNVCLPR